jgi:hypothetical protein
MSSGSRRRRSARRGMPSLSAGRLQEFASGSGRGPRLTANGHEAGQPTPFYRSRLRSAVIGSSLRGLWPKPVSSEGRDRRNAVWRRSPRNTQNAPSSILVDKRLRRQRQRRKRPAYAGLSSFWCGSGDSTDPVLRGINAIRAVLLTVSRKSALSHSHLIPCGFGGVR